MIRSSIKVLVVTSHSDRPEAETFIGLRALGVDVRVLCSPKARHFDRLADAGVPVKPLEFARRLDRAAINLIRTELIEQSADVLHLFNNRAVVNGLIAARGTNARIVAYRGIVGNESFLNPFSWMRYLNPRVDRIVCVAEAIRRHFLAMGTLGFKLPTEKVVTIYKGHDLAWYREKPADLASFGVPKDAFVVGCVANWRPRKGIEVLIRAYDSLPKNAPIHLLLVGEMANRDLLAAIRKSAYTDRIHRVGFHANAPALIAACDAAVLPSVKREGLPKTVIEAMAYGVPPVVTDCGGSAELVVDGVSGYVVPVRDAPAIAQAILKLYGDPGLRQRLGQAARDRIATEFRIDDTIAQTRALYRDLVSAEGRA